jgi:hypothetical protein
MFKEPQREREYVEKGFTVLTMRDAGPVQALQNIFCNNCGSPNSDGLYYSLMGDAETNRRIKSQIASVMRPVLDQWFEDYTSATESFLMKGKKDVRELELHQDWCYVDEDHYSSVTLWVPLQDVHNVNGCMFFLPGSHKVFRGFRSGSYPTARISGMGRLADHVEAVPLRIGQAVAFHPGVFHGSFPNQSGRMRRVMGAMILAKGASMCYYHRADDYRAEVYAIGEQILFSELESLSAGAPPSNAFLLCTREYSHCIPNEESLCTRMG